MDKFWTSKTTSLFSYFVKISNASETYKIGLIQTMSENGLLFDRLMTCSHLTQRHHHLPTIQRNRLQIPVPPNLHNTKIIQHYNTLDWALRASGLLLLAKSLLFMFVEIHLLNVHAHAHTHTQSVNNQNSRCMCVYMFVLSLWLYYGAKWYLF